MKRNLVLKAIDWLVGNDFIIRVNSSLYVNIHAVIWLIFVALAVWLQLSIWLPSLQWHEVTIIELILTIVLFCRLCIIDSSEQEETEDWEYE